MALAAEKAGVGPMAAVAGAIADLAVKDMIREGCEVAVVENGGEIFAVSNRSVDVAVAAGEEPLSKRFGFRLTEFPIGVATSSGRFSHALSFGDAEAATVFCKNATLADAAATAVGNEVKGEDAKAGIEAGIKRGLAVEGVEGVMVIYKGEVGTAYNRPNYDIIGGQRLRNGQYAIVTSNGLFVRLDAAGKELKSFPIGQGLNSFTGIDSSRF
jgi:ApbE superfamily uncharacterized protein (UPF0280 family)